MSPAHVYHLTLYGSVISHLVNRQHVVMFTWLMVGKRVVVGSGNVRSSMDGRNVDQCPLITQPA